MRFAFQSTFFLAFVVSLTTAQDAQVCTPYDQLSSGKKCTGQDNIVFTSNNHKTVPECYEECLDVKDCNFFSFVKGVGHEGYCIGCTNNDTTDEADANHYNPHNGCDDQIVDPNADPCNNPYVFRKSNAKCPYGDVSRIFRTDDNVQNTLDECYKMCQETKDCRYFTFGSEQVEKNIWRGMCMGCTVNAVDDVHTGFLHYYMNEQCEDNTFVYQGGGAKQTPSPTNSPTPSPTDSPTPSPTDSPTPSPTDSAVDDSGVRGDPHFKTWDGKLYDFHGICDMILLHNPGFLNGLGMEIHIRSSKTRQWSYISRAVVLIGSEMFELSTTRDRIRFSTEYWVNGVSGKNDNPSQEDTMVLPNTVSGFQIHYRSVNSQQSEYTIRIDGEDSDETLSLHTWKHMIRVDVNNGSAKNFGSSLGLMGAFSNSQKLGRDGASVMEDLNAFGQEWQVLPGEPKLFQVVEGPQAPSKCEIPSKTQLRRRLAESEVSVEAAQKACASVANKDDFDLCVFDVIATGDVGSVGVY